MKVAVCIFGLCRGNVESCIETHQHHFGKYDTFYGTWSDIHSLVPKHLANQRNISEVLPGVSYFTTPEPVMHYHPRIDTDLRHLRPDVRETLAPIYNEQRKPTQEYDRTLHHTKQIIGHALQIDRVPVHYDMIIRLRFDTVLSTVVDFHPYIEQSYEQNLPIGFGDAISSAHPRCFEFDKLKQHPSPPPYYITDFMIFHPRQLFDTRSVIELHSNKQLLPGERGWYQILSMPHGDRHLNMLGGALIRRMLK